MADKQAEILSLAKQLIEFPAVSTGSHQNKEGVKKCYQFIFEYLMASGLRVIEFKGKRESPALYADCAPADSHPVGDILLVGHFDRVSPHHPSQATPKIEGNWLKGRGTADMLTVVATYLVFFKDQKHKTKSFPPRIGLLLVGNEEPGESEKWGTPHVLTQLRKSFDYRPGMMIIGERTGDGRVKKSKIETRNRGVIRAKLDVKQKSGHTAFAKGRTALDRILLLMNHVKKILPHPADPFWKTTFIVPYLNTGEIDNFNIMPSKATAGFEIRPIPEDDAMFILDQISKKAEELRVDINFINREPGIMTPVDDPRVQDLLKIAAFINGGQASDYLGRGKLPGTQARFAPKGCAAVVFGQSGVGPHSENEAHYIPSIMPYYRVLSELDKISF